MTARQANLLAAFALAMSDRIHESAGAEAGRGGQAAAALTILAQQDELSIEGLRAQLGLSQPAATRLVDALVADRSVERRPGPDGRTRHLALTRTGRRRANRVLAARRAAADEALNALGAADRVELEGLLEALLGAVTPDRPAANRICRLCDLAACPQRSCPVETTAAATEV